MQLKPALSIEDQIQLLQQRGMIIEDQTYAVTFLSCNHYYRLNIYFHKLMDGPDHFQKGTRFSQIISIYSNDRWLRNRILFILEPIEIKTRTQIAHHLAIKYGADAFYRKEIFKNEEIWQEILSNFSKEISRNQKDPVIKHHQAFYDGLFPIWVIIEFLSFNTLSRLFGNLQEYDKRTIARNCYGINEHIFGQWLHVLSVLRNICAHYGYLYRRQYALRPTLEKSSGWDLTRNSELFAFFLVMRRLSEGPLWQDLIKDIFDAEFNKALFLRDYGFPKNWLNYLQ